jgi:hypothetical protein
LRLRITPGQRPHLLVVLTIPYSTPAHKLTVREESRAPQAEKEDMDK